MNFLECKQKFDNENKGNNSYMAFLPEHLTFSKSVNLQNKAKTNEIE